MKAYEALFIFSPSLQDEALEKILERIRGEITKLKGVIHATQPTGERTFARPLKRKQSGLFVNMDFSVDPQAITPLLARFKLNEDIFRVRILRVDKPRNVQKSSHTETADHAES